MPQLTLVIGNKNYSSWSLRPWLAMKQLGLEFQEIQIPLYNRAAVERIRQYSPAGKVPILLDGSLTVWDSLAILAHLMERFPDLSWLPEDQAARAVARSICAEMHSGFQNLRHQMPMNCRAYKPGKGMTPGVQADIDRITSIWRDSYTQFGQGGPFLFGSFTIADAMYAPVVVRFRTYGVTLDPISQAYADTIWNLPTMQEWVRAGVAEPEVIEPFEI